MGGPLSVILSDIFMTKLEEEVVIPRNPKFYRRFVDDSFNIRKKDVPDELFEKLNKFKPSKIRFTIETAPSKFLDTKVKVKEMKFETALYHKTTKLPPHWSSKTPKRYKRNAINGNLHRAFRISSEFEKEVNIIKEKYLNAGYPLKFVNNCIKSFRDYKNQEESLIPDFLFKEKKTQCYLEVPFCFQNEKVMNKFLKRFHNLTDNKFEIKIKWQTKKIRTLFKLKDPNPYPACVIYEGTCNCGESYIGETERNAVTRWEEHKNTKRNSEPAKHLKHNPNHAFNWKILCRASKFTRDRKNLEAYFIARKKPSLNNQIESKTLVLFRNGIG